MSKTESDGYPRGNFWGEMTDYDDQPDQDAGDYGVGDGPESNPGPGGTWKPDPNDPNEIIAHQLLRDTARMLCSETLFAAPALPGGRTQQLFAWLFDDDCLEHDPGAHHHAKREVELTEPRVRPPMETVRDQRHRVRINDEIGYLTGGHSTGVVLQDRRLEELIAVINLWLTGRQTDVPDSIKQDARDRAYRQKREGDKRDVEIVADVVEHVRTETK